jgi:hypothetical protein
VCVGGDGSEGRGKDFQNLPPLIFSLPHPLEVKHPTSVKAVGTAWRQLVRALVEALRWFPCRHDPNNPSTCPGEEEVWSSWRLF